MVIWKLKMRTRQKVGLFVVMAMSLVTMTAALAKIAVSLIPMTDSDVLGDPATQYFASIINFTSDCEQCLVIIMGCIPTLHLASRLKIPTISEFRNSVSNLLRSRRSKSGTHSDTQTTGAFHYGNSHQDSSRYHELQFTPKLRRSEEDSFSSTALALAPHGQPPSPAHLSGNPGETQIHRTASFSVSYNHHTTREGA